KTPLKTAGDVVFATAFGDFKVARGPDAAIARIETQHDFAQTYKVPTTVLSRLDCHWHSGVSNSSHAPTPVSMSARSRRGTSRWITSSATRYAEPAMMNIGK